MWPKKILIVEDQDGVGESTKSTLQNHFSPATVDLSQFCDDAYIKFQKEEKMDVPFDLLVTDLSFRQHYKYRMINSGKALIQKIRFLNKSVPIILYSVEEREFLVQTLFQKCGINAYVLKGSVGLHQMAQAG